MDNQVVSQQSMLEEVLIGMKQSQKSLPSKYFYDERGSELFEQITHLEEYYPTRTERAIMHDYIDEIVECIGRDPVLIELGSGSSRKTRLLLDYHPGITAYVPVEISEEYLVKVVRELKKEYPDLLIKPVCADYTEPFQVPVIEKGYSNYVFFYPGSTIGNFRPEQARKFMAMISQILNQDGGMLVGVDLKKDKEILEAAYNDTQGLTAKFNKNILRHINRELDADFNLDKFRHKAIYNEEEGRIEMHLVSDLEHKVTIAGEQFMLKKGESIHTENSYKYSLETFKALVNNWFSIEKVWTDENNYFSLQYLVKK